MTKSRTVVGLIAGILMILSSFAHAFLGWPTLRGQLVAAGVPRPLIVGMRFGWQFGGVAMLAFGVIVAAGFLARLRGRDVPTFPAAVIAGAYVAFGLWALLVSNFDPFFFAFLVPGILLAIAAPKGRRG